MYHEHVRTPLQIPGFPPTTTLIKTSLRRYQDTRLCCTYTPPSSHSRTHTKASEFFVCTCVREVG